MCVPRQLDFDSLASLTEVVAVGTAVAAVPVRSITRLSTNTKFVFANTSGAEGVESRLMGLACTMSNIQRGLCDDTEGWCWEVMATEEEVGCPGDGSRGGLGSARAAAALVAGGPHAGQAVPNDAGSLSFSAQLAVMRKWRRRASACGR